VTRERRKQPRSAIAATGGKRPVTVEPATSEKRPFVGAPSLKDSAELLSWRFAIADPDGPWAWANCQPDDLVDILAKLGAREQSKWAQLHRKHNHSVTIDQLSPAAQRRLREINQDDAAELYTMRLTGERRVWGILHGSCMYLLWWDPRHEVCPSPKKHT
jgi:hypothetical protein